MTPAIVLGYLRELSTDLLAAVVLDATGEPLAGSRALGAVAAELLGAASGAPLAQARTDRHLVVVARSREHAVIAVHTAYALPSLVRHDLVTVLGDLAAGPAGGATADAPPRELDGSHPAVAAAVRAALEPVRSASRAAARPIAR